MTLVDFITDRLYITAAQIEEALDLQEQRGGSLGDQLITMHLVTEAQLLRALQTCYSWKTVELYDLQIDNEILKTLPRDKAWELKALPFAEDSKENILKIACINPEDASFKEKIEEFIEGRRIELYAAVESVLEHAIKSNYQIHSQLDSDQKSVSTSNKKTSEKKSEAEIENNDAVQKRACIISPEWEVDRYLGSALVQEGYKVVMATTPSEVIEEIDDNRFEVILIREAEYGDDQPLLSRVIYSARGKIVRQYESTCELLDTDPIGKEHAAYLSANLHLFTAALAKGLNLPLTNAVKIGPLVQRLCRKMNLTPHDHMITVIAGYIQDVSAIYFRDNLSIDRETAFFMLQAAGGDALVYPPTVLNVIRKMYPKLSELTQSSRKTVEILNGNIVTAVDFYLRNFREQDKMTLRQYHAVEVCLREQIGPLLLPEVVDALLEILREDIIRPNKADSPDHALILNDQKLISPELKECIKSCGYESTIIDNIDDCISRYHKIVPDVLIISTKGSLERANQLLLQLAARRIVLSKIPSFVLYTSDDHENICNLLKLGLHDVISVKNSYDILKLRLQRIATEREQESRQRLAVLQDMGTHGTLEHMNVIDLLQAMGPSNKTLCINVTAKSNQLMMFLNKGQLLHAQCDDKTGAAAVYEALSWERGVWSVDHISPSELPEPNVQRSIDSILIEGCHLLDELDREKIPPGK